MAKMTEQIKKAKNKSLIKKNEKFGESKKMASSLPSARSAAEKSAYKAATKLVRNQLVSQRTSGALVQAVAKKAVPIIANRIQTDRSRAATRSRAESKKLAMAEKKTKKKAVNTAARKIVSGR